MLAGAGKLVQNNVTTFPNCTALSFHDKIFPLVFMTGVFILKVKRVANDCFSVAELAMSRQKSRVCNDHNSSKPQTTTSKQICENISPSLLCWHLSWNASAFYLITFWAVSVWSVVVGIGAGTLATHDNSGGQSGLSWADLGRLRNCVSHSLWPCPIIDK